MSDTAPGVDASPAATPVGHGHAARRSRRAGLAAAVAAATGCAIRRAAAHRVRRASAVAWMSPDELLLFWRPARAPHGRARSARRLPACITSWSTSPTPARVFRIDGPGAREVLARGAPVDLAPAAFGPGDFRRTRLGQVAAAFWMPEPDAFDLVCFRSVAGFVADWLDSAARPGMSAPGLWRERHPGQSARRLRDPFAPPPGLLEIRAILRAGVATNLGGP